MKILVTRAAGFIGIHAVLKLLEQGLEITVLGNLNSYYDPNLKLPHLDQLQSESGFQLVPNRP